MAPLDRKCPADLLANLQNEQIKDSCIIDELLVVAHFAVYT